MKFSRFLAALLSIGLATVVPGCSDDDPVSADGSVIVSDVSGPFCTIDNVNCDETVNIAFHLRGVDSAVDSTFVIIVDRMNDDILDEELVTGDVLTGTFPNYVVEVTLPVGRHKLQITFEEDSGVRHTGTVPFRIVDCRAPEPVCINGLAVELQPVSPPADVDGDGDLDSGATTIFAADFVASPVTDCSPPVIYSINRTGQTPKMTQTSLVVTCDDPGTITVEIHAWDSENNPSARQPDNSTGGPNNDFCGSFVLVQDNTGVCN